MNKKLIILLLMTALMISPFFSYLTLNTSTLSSSHYLSTATYQENITHPSHKKILGLLINKKCKTDLYKYVLLSRVYRSNKSVWRIRNLIYIYLSI